jgi:hypothetical protein
MDARSRKARAIAHHLIRWDVMREREYVFALFDAIKAAGKPPASP